MNNQRPPILFPGQGILRGNRFGGFVVNGPKNMEKQRFLEKFHLMRAIFTMKGVDIFSEHVILITES